MDDTATPECGEEEAGEGGGRRAVGTFGTNCHHGGPWERTDAGGGGGGSGREQSRRAARRPGGSGSEVVCPESRPYEEVFVEEWVQSHNSQQNRSLWRLKAAQRRSFESDAPAGRRRGTTRGDACDGVVVGRRR